MLDAFTDTSHKSRLLAENLRDSYLSRTNDFTTRMFIRFSLTTAFTASTFCCIFRK